MKRKLLFLLVIISSILFTACGGGNTEGNNSESKNNQIEVAETVKDKSDDSQMKVDFNAEEPVLLTTVGQSADVEMVKAIFDNLGINYSMDNMVEKGGLNDSKTLILAVGGSSKGLGAAGIDANAELERIKGLIEDAKNNGTKIIAMHIGGEARRGELSDKFIAPSFEQADYAIVVSEGDKDGKIKGIAEEKNIPMEYVDAMSDTLDSLKTIFNN